MVYYRLPPEILAIPGSWVEHDDDTSDVDVEEDPIATLEQLQESWRKRDHAQPWSKVKLPDLDLEDVDWHKYHPPRAVRKAPIVTSQILLDLVQVSVDNLLARVAAEDAQKLEDEQLRQAEELEAKKEAAKGKEPYLPVIIVQDEPEPKPDDAPPFSPWSFHSHTEQWPMTADPDPLPAKAEKRRRFALRRFFQLNSSERGESSVVGSAREVLRQKLEAALGGPEGESADTRAAETISALSRRGTQKSITCELTECVSCLDDFPIKDAIKAPCHSYCPDCFVRLITAACQNEQQWPPKCCLNEIPSRTIMRFIPKDLKATYNERSEEWSLPVSERVYCAQPDCSLWIRTDRIDKSWKRGRCERGHWTCIICRGPQHRGEDCPQDQDMQLTNLLADEEGWKRCGNCHALVEHREACQHMTCRCGFQFCYVCGQRWRTCRCTMQQLDRVKRDATARREVRMVREQNEAQRLTEQAEELRQILAQIAEFEREEELKAELLRQEQVRIEEERRQRELEERVRQESSRRRDVEIKFQGLRESLDLLHELQLVLVELDQEEAGKELVAEAQSVREALVAKHEAERADMTDLILAKVSAKEHAFTKDYSRRVAKERKIEDEYLQQLQEFWQGKPGAPEAIETAMLPLRKRMDQGYRSWQKWKHGELGTYRAKLEDERTISEELMYSMQQRTEDRYAERATDLERRKVAEKKWLHEVILERERLLGDLEVQEMEGDADSLFAPEHSDLESTSEAAGP